jgi:hypothetical protein
VSAQQQQMETGAAKKKQIISQQFAVLPMGLHNAAAACERTSSADGNGGRQATSKWH